MTYCLLADGVGLPTSRRSALNRHELNSDLVKCFLRDSVFKSVLTDRARGDAYRRIRDDHEMAG